MPCGDLSKSWWWHIFVCFLGGGGVETVLNLILLLAKNLFNSQVQTKLKAKTHHHGIPGLLWCPLLSPIFFVTIVFVTAHLSDHPNLYNLTASHLRSKSFQDKTCVKYLKQIPTTVHQSVWLTRQPFVLTTSSSKLCLYCLFCEYWHLIIFCCIKEKLIICMPIGPKLTKLVFWVTDLYLNF